MRSMCFSFASVLKCASCASETFYFEGMFKTLRAFAPSSSEFIPFLACHHSITDFEINVPESRLIQTPQVCVRFSFNFRHWLILFHQPIAISQSLGL